MTSRARANGEGSIFTYRNGWAAYVWVTTPTGTRERKWLYGQDREELHGRWIDPQQQARNGPAATKVPKLADYIAYWLQEIVTPNLAPLTCATYESLTRLYVLPYLGEKRLDKLTVRDVQSWVYRETKTEASEATLPLPQICIAALQQRRTAQERARQAAGSAWHETDLVFTTRHGRPVEPRNFNRYFVARCAVAGVRTISGLDARWTCASLLVDLDVHPRVVMRILRHANLRPDHGGVRAGVLGGDPGGAQAAGGVPRWLSAVAVLRCCTDARPGSETEQEPGGEGS